jgi:hypothetical protein
VRPEPEVDGRLGALERQVARLESRLAELEGATPRSTVAAPDEAVQTSSETAENAPGLDRLLGVPALVGRTFVVLGGAFLFRSLTDSGTLSAALGVGLGIAYALVWLVLADRAAGRGRPLDGAFHAVASALVVYPLLFEATIRFALLGSWVSATLIAAANAAGLLIAWRRDFRALAWIHQVAALAVAVPLLFRTKEPAAYVALLLLLALASLVLAYVRGWRGQRWLVAVAVDGVFLMLAALLVVGRRPPEWLATDVVLASLLGLVVIYLTAFVHRLLIQARPVTGFAVGQTVVVLALGFEGALHLGGDDARRYLAYAALAVGALLHGGLARRSELRFGHGATVGYFTSVATFLLAESARVLLPSALAASLWLAAAVTLAVLALGGDRPILQAHAALLSLAGAVLSGLVAASAMALLRSPEVAWLPLGPGAGFVLALAMATAVLLYRGATATGPDRLAAASRTLALAVALLGLGGFVVSFAVAAIEPGAGAAAVVRTVVLAAAAVGLATAGPLLRRAELGRFAWALLVLGGLKLAAEDLRVGEAAHLVVSLALYGAALIAVPALLRRARKPKNSG